MGFKREAVVIEFRTLETRVGDLLNRFLDRARVRFVSLAVLAVSLIFLVVTFATSDHGRTFFGPPLGADFAGFYTAGTILNRAGEGNRLYDAELYDRLYHQLLPNLPEEAKLPYVYPPFVALAFRVLALLPYEWSFAVWLVISAGLYLAGLALVGKALPTFSGSDRSTALLLALSFEPFIMECWIGGQLSAFGFFCVAVALFLDRDRPLAAGMALGLCLYKPTLLVLLVPMLVVARRFRMFAGFCLTGVVLAGLSLVGAGRQTCLDYAGVLFGFARTTTATGTGLELRLWKYVDLNSFLRLLLGRQPALHWVVFFALAVAPLIYLVVCWWKLDQKGEGYRHLVWAATLTWSLVLNLYVGIYDSILSVLGALLTAEVLNRRRRSPGGAPLSFFPLFLVLLYLVPWISQPLARATGWQLDTLVLMAMATYQLRLARKDAGVGA